MTVVVDSWLPQEKPQASGALISAVKRYLDRRRLVGTRLVVAGPRYREVGVTTTFSLTKGSFFDRVRLDIEGALNRFLNPLYGGPQGRGWPFGRDVYRTDILDLVGGVPGVDHVDSLELVTDSQGPQCGNICVPSTGLVCPGKHDIQLSSGGNRT